MKKDTKDRLLKVDAKLDVLTDALYAIFESLRDTQEKMGRAIRADEEEEVKTYTASESKDFKPIHIEETDKAVVIKSKENELRKLLSDCRDELCLRCGLYKTSYMGTCDNCRWASGREWETL